MDEEGRISWINKKPLNLNETYWKDGEPNNLMAHWDKDNNNNTVDRNVCQSFHQLTLIRDQGEWFRSFDDITRVGANHLLCEKLVETDYFLWLPEEGSNTE